MKSSLLVQKGCEALAGGTFTSPWCFCWVFDRHSSQTVNSWSVNCCELSFHRHSPKDLKPCERANQLKDHFNPANEHHEIPYHGDARTNVIRLTQGRRTIPVATVRVGNIPSPELISFLNAIFLRVDQSNRKGSNREFVGSYFMIFFES